MYSFVDILSLSYSEVESTVVNLFMRCAKFKLPWTSVFLGTFKKPCIRFEVEYTYWAVKTIYSVLNYPKYFLTFSMIFLYCRVSYTTYVSHQISCRESLNALTRHFQSNCWKSIFALELIFLCVMFKARL